MKSILQLLALLLITNFAVAQSTGISKLPVTPSMTYTKYKVSPNFIRDEQERMKKAKPTRSTFESWMNYGDLFDSYYSAGGPYYAPLLLFPDSEIIYGTSSTAVFYPRYHSAATIFDPYNMLEPDYTIPAGASYTMDSFLFRAAYVKNLPDNIVDTVVISIFRNYPGYWYGVTINGGDTLRWKFAPYDYTVNSVPDSALWIPRMTIPLTDEILDTSGTNNSGTIYFKNSKHFDISGIPQIPYADVIGIAISFKPGYTYTMDDSIGEKNGFYLLSSEENGTGTAQTVNDLGNYNVSYVATKTNVYNDTAGNNFYFQYYPAFGYTDPFPFENHGIYVHITSQNVGTKDLSFSNGLNFYPNPSKGEASFHYSLSRNAKQVSFKVFNVAGKEVTNMVENSQTAGVHKFSFNTSEMTSGIYFYSFTVDGQTNNGKFVVD